MTWTWKAPFATPSFSTSRSTHSVRLTAQASARNVARSWPVCRRGTPMRSPISVGLGWKGSSSIPRPKPQNCSFLQLPNFKRYFCLSVKQKIAARPLKKGNLHASPKAKDVPFPHSSSPFHVEDNSRSNHRLRSVPTTKASAHSMPNLRYLQPSSGSRGLICLTTQN